MTSRTSHRPLVVAVATAILSVTLASAELLAQPPAPEQPVTPPAQPGTPPPAPPAITPAQPPTPSAPTPPTATPPSPSPPPGLIEPSVTMTGCVRRIERMDTDNATIANVIIRPMTAYVLEPSGGKADDQRRVTGLIAGNQGIRLEDRIGKAVEVSGTLRPPMAIGSAVGSAEKGADTLAVTELQPMVVRSLKLASVQCK
jgi:hypothetical protein